MRLPQSRTLSPSSGSKSSRLARLARVLAPLDQLCLRFDMVSSASPSIDRLLQTHKGRVDRYKGIPPFPETRAYVRRVMGLYGRSSHEFDESITDASPWLRPKVP